MVQTVRPISEIFTLLADNNMGAISAQDMRDAIISLAVNTTPIWSDIDWPADHLVLRSDGIYQANDEIPAGTGFVEGTTGATWTHRLQVASTAGLGENQLLFLGPQGLQTSDVRIMPNREIIIPDESRAGPLGLGPLTTLLDVNSFARISNRQFPDVVFDFPDARSRITGETERPRHFRLNEARNPFDVATGVSETLTQNPMQIDYTVQLNAETSGIMFRAAEAMTNVRVTVRYSQDGQQLIRRLPTTEAVLSGQGGYDFAPGDNMLDFWPERAFRLFTGDQIRIMIEADNIALAGENGFPRVQFLVQRGEFRDLAWFQDLAPFNRPSISALSIDGVTDLHPDAPFTLTGSQTFRYTVARAENVQSGRLLQNGAEIAALTPAEVAAGTVAATINDVALNAQGNSVAFRLELTDVHDQIETRDLTIRVPLPADLVYIWSQDGSTVNALDAGAQSAVFQSGTQRLTVPAFTDGQHLVIAQRASDPPLTELIIASVNQLPGFTETAGAFTVDGQSYDAYVSNNGLVNAAIGGQTISLVR